MYTSNSVLSMRKPTSPFKAPCRATCTARRPLMVRAAAPEQRAAAASGITAAALAAALLLSPAAPATAAGGEVYTGPNFNAGLQAGQRQAAANTAEMGAAPTGEVKKGSPLVPSATKQTGQPGSLFKGLAQGAAESLKAASSETAAAQAFKDAPATADKANTQKGYFAVKDLASRTGQDPTPEEAAEATGSKSGGAFIKDMYKRVQDNQK